MRRKVLLGCGIPLLVMVGGGWWGYRKLTASPIKPPRYAKAEKGAVEIKVTETGTIEPLKKLEVKSKVAGRVKKMYVMEGAVVRSGDVLAEIDPTEIDSQVEQMRAQLAGSRARLEQAKRGVTYQVAQTATGIRQYVEGVAAAEARLRVAEEESKSQPSLTASDVETAEASVRSAQAAMDLLKGATQPQAEVQARSGLTDAQATADNSRRNLERQKRLFEKGFTSQQSVDMAETDLAGATARLDQARKRVELIQNQQRLEIADAQERISQARSALNRAKAGTSIVTVRQQEVLSARAALAQARAQLDMARKSIEQDRMRGDDVAQARSAVVQIENQLREIEVRQGDTRLITTMPGTVTRKYMEEGELVTSGVSTFSSGTPVFQVADLSKMLVKMSVNEVDVHKINPGLPVEITIDGARGVVFRGTVRKVAPAAAGDGQPGAGGGAVIRFAVEIGVDRPDQRLRPGMSARCVIVIARRRDVVRLPADAVAGNGDKASVQVVVKKTVKGKPTDTFVKRPVRAGLRGDTFVEVISGLKPGEQVKPGIFTGPKRKAIDLDFK